MGCATASRFSDILTVKKYGSTKARDDYLWQLVVERLYEKPTPVITSKSLNWGHSLESYAREAYEVETGSIVSPSPFVRHTRIAYCGSSPDGLIGLSGGIEVKCPLDSRIHLQTWQQGMQSHHIAQVQGNLWVTDREWFDFISYDPRATPEFQLYIQRIFRDEKFIENMQDQIVKFLAEVADKTELLRGKIK
jgi:hypothetical protein